MSDPQLNALATQVQSISSQILNESSARLKADAALAERVGSLENLIESAKLNMGSIQSTDYVQGMSGLKIDFKTGHIELNSCTLGSFEKSPERQLVSVEVASWSKYDLPKNAANLLQFMQAELQKVPEQYRHAAEFEEYDASYGDESFNARLFLSYSRLETEEELADRLKKAKAGGARILHAGGCTTGIVDGVVRWRFGDLSAPVDIEPSKVVDGVTYVTADRFAINGRSASDILRDIAGKIDETKLGQDLKEQVDLLGSSLADQIKAVIRKELIPGGLLHRWR
ncbi:hypothetical protein C4J96_4573 [Pseudomonas orientalis]|uniref:hypothetical protein n=1 Tax=Pseudomonas orientalis TaxID=76758 RepID=UPI000F6BEA86|nr:hypothetical protein [Pseudomonas orientalis]AZE96651.1 hypothetical protein C4J96_4573 [Pseudomonas orientalis]